MNVVLGIFLLILMLVVGGRRGGKSFLSLCFNYGLLILAFVMMAWGVHPILVALLVCALISYLVLYYVNGKTVKTRAAMYSVFLVLIVLAVLIYGITMLSRSGGFGEESFEEINMFSYYIFLDMNLIAVALVLIGLIGATIDTAIAVTSAMYEVYQNNLHLTQKELFHSGITVGKDILGTTTNTLLFAYLGEFMTLVIWFKQLSYSLADVANAKVFVAEFIKIMCSGLGCILIIPIASWIMSILLKRENLH